uniref:PDDEXK nuclease domain-containing protein n=1 Tax=Bacteroides thetaiotaomicron TaxID=818 RepID=UPI00374E1443
MFIYKGLELEANINGYATYELKNGNFKPEHLGQLNFYQNLINNTLRGEYDNPTIGMLLCRDKDRIEVEYALQNISSPIGVSEFNVKELLPDNLKSKLPTIEEVEEELNKFVE